MMTAAVILEMLQPTLLGSEEAGVVEQSAIDTALVWALDVDVLEASLLHLGLVGAVVVISHARYDASSVLSTA